MTDINNMTEEQDQIIKRLEANLPDFESDSLEWVNMAVRDFIVVVLGGMRTKNQRRRHALKSVINIRRRV